MTIPMERVKERYSDVIAQADNPAIRHFFLPTRYNFRTPMEDVPPGRWEAATPQNVLRFTAIGVPSAGPPYARRQAATASGTSIALAVHDKRSGKSLLYMPGLSQMSDTLAAYAAAADCMLVEGTCFYDDEMARSGCGTKRAADMGHMALGGSTGLLAQLERIPGPRKVLIHINNTNPILNEDSPEHAAVIAAGVEVAHDGMEITL